MEEPKTEEIKKENTEINEEKPATEEKKAEEETVVVTEEKTEEGKLTTVKDVIS